MSYPVRQTNDKRWDVRAQVKDGLILAGNSPSDVSLHTCLDSSLRVTWLYYTLFCVVSDRLLVYILGLDTFVVTIDIHL